ncbi:hypothetical protein HDU77_010107 [Chytriomyces hyalinus]|nr:hypothetical protein HDU77_010107 [Chytriomyces hyalinus]
MSTLLNINSAGSDSLPMHIHHSTTSDKYRRGTLASLVSRYVRTIINDPQTRNVFFFLLLNMTFTVVEFLFGWWTNSLGLLSDAVHMLFDSTALILSLIASVIAKWQATEAFSYGFGRVETLTGFANALALVFASLGIIWEAVERMFDPPKINTDSLLTVSVLGLLVNLVGIFAFDHGGMGHDHGHGGGGCSSGGGGHSHGFDFFGGAKTVSSGEHEPFIAHDSHGHDHHAAASNSGHSHSNSHSHSHGGHDSHAAPVPSVAHTHNHSDAGHSHASHSHGSHSHGSHGHNPLMHGMFLHVLSDTLGSVGVILSTLFIKWFGWTWSDPLISLAIALMTLVSIWPLLRGSSYTLLQRAPESLDGRLDECFRKVSIMPGVVGYSNPHFWELCQGRVMGTLKIQINAAVCTSPDMLRIKVVTVFREVGVTDLIVQIETDVVQGY